jgi:hypothetical protein
VVGGELILGSKFVGNDNLVEDRHDAIFITEASLQDEEDDVHTFNDEEDNELPYSAYSIIATRNWMGTLSDYAHWLLHDEF